MFFPATMQEPAAVFEVSLAGKQQRLESSLSLENDLRPEVLLLGGVVAHAHLQHPL